MVFPLLHCRLGVKHIPGPFDTMSCFLLQIKALLFKHHVVVALEISSFNNVSCFFSPCSQELDQ